MMQESPDQSQSQDQSQQESQAVDWQAEHEALESSINDIGGQLTAIESAFDDIEFEGEDKSEEGDVKSAFSEAQDALDSIAHIATAASNRIKALL